MKADFSLEQNLPAIKLRWQRLIGAILMALGMALLGTPNRFEGPSLLHLSPGHGVSVSDVIALVPLIGGGILMGQALWLQRQQLRQKISWVAIFSSTEVFLAGLATGIFMSRVFTMLPWSWLLLWTAIMGLLLTEFWVVRRFYQRP